MAVGTTLKISFNSSEVQRGLASLKAGFTNIAKIGVTAFKAIGVGAIAGVAGIAALAIKLNSIGEAGISGDRALQNVAKQMGIFGDETDKVTERLIDFADVTARQAGLDGAALGATQTKLLTFKELAESADIAGGAFDRATMAAFDMASAGFGTAETNAVQLGKALNDPIKGINSLTRSGITFTAEEKKMIDAMVESGDIMKAQGVILEAIETQVGGTATATADASKQIKASFEQIVDAFAEPFSTGFSSLPGALESVFAGLVAQAEKFGSHFANAISDAIAGNYEKFAAMGELIGTILSEGTVKTFKTGLRNLGANVLSGIDSAENAIRGAVGIETESNLGVRATEAADVMAAEDTRQMINAIKASAQPVIQGNQGLVPGTSGSKYQFAPPGSNSPLSDINGNKVVEVLSKIENNTAQGAKM